MATPSTATSPSAESIRAMAASRSCPVADDLGDHGIIMEADLIAFPDARIDAQPSPAGGKMKRFSGPGEGMKFLAGFSA